MPIESTSIWARGRAKLLIFCWLGWVFDFYDLILFSFTKRAIASELGLSLYGEIAWVEGASLLATAIGGFAFGRLADRQGPRVAMVASILMYSLGSILTGFSQGFITLLVARFVTGLGVGGEWGIGHALVAEHWSGKERDRVHAILQAGSPFAMMLAAIVGSWFAGPFGFRAVFIAGALPAFLALWARRAFAQNIELRAPAPHVSARELWAPKYRRASAVLLAILVLHMAGFWGVYAEMPAALMQLHHVGAQEVGWFQIKVNSVHIVADLAFGWFAASFGRIRTFLVSSWIFALGQMFVLHWLDLATSDFATFTLIVAAMGLGAGTWSCFGALFGEHYPVALRATAAATFYAGARAIQLVLKPALGWAFAATGSFAPALYLGIGCALGSALLLVFALPRQREVAVAGD
jgi:MFS family permease